MGVSLVERIRSVFTLPRGMEKSKTMIVDSQPQTEIRKQVNQVEVAEHLREILFSLAPNKRL